MFISIVYARDGIHSVSFSRYEEIVIRSGASDRFRVVPVAANTRPPRVRQHRRKADARRVFETIARSEIFDFPRPVIAPVK